ncbi:hypothetical protein BOX15_Mlig025490g4 [Macrostomum lignano]|uniref:WSC domain-containing protein n=1 Tax=Macrostomum lignano TaxID=282301 RepID=A0A267DJQ4_9PLAT|nr:hypothetical protein BOX15_Mlig025490g3 [Macrostomum lignano]PAA48864.1 hypothetical protein BOX15_Mlig025490g2 [Macrostomum lignano]PAA60486.1 hypothetical protein BOX15_Mlig025490g1 [Macrostomum lignano]PAA81329.1 hypothetical protein BOX15_Mlig025490g4 [Macrostomum lignano]
MSTHLVFLFFATCLFTLNSLGNCCKKSDEDREKNYKFTYKGCYIDREDDRDLEKFLGASRMMSRRECTERCKPEKTAYIGLQAGDSCYCGNNYGKHGKADDSYCFTTCKGHPGEFCGGKPYNSVYTLGKEV